jgi:acetyltransferase-like isoleucine patch superfamily enzyme
MPEDSTNRETQFLTTIARVQSFSLLLEKLSPLFFWLKWFYPKSKGIPIAFQLYFFLPQKILRINGRVPWPVHFTSRILYHRNISVGNWCAPGMNSGCYIQARNGIIIGHNLRMGPGCGLISANHDPSDYDIHLPHPPIVIGSNVWLGMNTVILPGVKIGDNVIIGANSVVRNDIPANVVASGNPCVIIREKAPYTGKDYSLL